MNKDTSLRRSILRKLYQFSPYNIQGDLKGTLPKIKNGFISCLVCTARDSHVLKELLNDFAQQTLDKNTFEFIILDNNINSIESMVQEYSSLVPIKYVQDDSKHGQIGVLRNELLKYAQGEYVLYLDDDSRLPQKDFLEKALSLFKQSDPDIIMPYGKAIAPPTKPDYKYLDPYSFATRCCFFKRDLLESVGGFRGDLIGYSDIELSMRLVLKDIKVLRTDELEYLHPSLYFDSLNKPLIIGQSIFKLKKYYPWYIWFMIYINGLRFLPLIIIPTTSNLQWFKISLGVLLAPFSPKRSNYLA